MRGKSLVASALATILVAPAVFAGSSNTGASAFGERGQHDLSAASGILYAPSEDDDPGYRAAISGITGMPVDYFDARDDTPSVELMSNYDCVYTWTNFVYLDNVAFGDNLARYVDTTGGRVVLGAFTAFTSGNFLDGRIMDPGYAPVSGGDNWFVPEAYAGDGTTPLHDGVTNYSCTFRDILSLQGDGAQDGSYFDGEIAAAYRPDFRVVYNNGAGAMQLGCPGQWPLLVANACGMPCQLHAAIDKREVQAGDAIMVRIHATHNRQQTVTTPFKIQITDNQGRLYLTDQTRAITMAYGDEHHAKRKITVPEGLSPGLYSVRIGVGQMRQGTVQAVREFRVIP